MALAAVGAVLLIAAVVIAGAFPLKPYRIPSQSMEPTIELNERVVVERVTVRMGDPERGDIVVFHPPDTGVTLHMCGVQARDDQACAKPGGRKSELAFIKRIVAGPGDRLSIRGGRVVVDGEPQDEDFARLDDACPVCNLPKEVTIPPDHWFMMGDNRGESADSREWGPVPEDWIVGRVVLTYWPPNRIGGH